MVRESSKCLESLVRGVYIPEAARTGGEASEQ